MNGLPTEAIALLEEREEGEIIDDLEDVSDCSMSPCSPFNIGKSVSHPELLSAVCLSSISTSEYSTTDGRSCIQDLPFRYHHDDEVREHRTAAHKRRRRESDYSEDQSLNNKRKYSKRRHHRKSIESTNSESENEAVDPKYARKLRAALRRESSQDLLHNSLKTRLKAFIEPDSQSQSEDDLSLAALRELAFSTLKPSDSLNNSKSDCDVIDSVKSEGGGDLKEQSDSEDDSDIEPPELRDLPIILDSIAVAEEKEKVEENVDGRDREDKSEILENTDGDGDLHELRLAALKTFIAERHKRRKKKLALENLINASDKEENDNKSAIVNEGDKENDQSIINNDLAVTDQNCICDKAKTDETEIVNENPVENLLDVSSKAVDEAGSSDCADNGIEEDADILRAALLASMTHKLTTKSLSNNNFATLNQVSHRVDNFKCDSLAVTRPLFKKIPKNVYRPVSKALLSTNHSKTFHKNKIIVEQPQLIVKPLIIKVNDSDSDTENTSNETNNQSLKDTVTEFLKKQRAEAEANKVVKTNESSEKSLINKSDDVLSEKSVVKLLPRSKQLEYRRLKQLLNARRKTRIKRLSQRLSESKREKVPKDKAKTDTIINPSESAEANNVEKKEPQPANSLQKTLSDMHIKKNGRLQMKGKYESLAPLLHRINQADNERQQHQIEIKNLLQQIEAARMRLAASHQNYTNLVQQLCSERYKIDKGTPKTMKPRFNIFTSTPNKFVKKIQTNVEKDATTKISVETDNIPSSDAAIKVEDDHSKENKKEIDDVHRLEQSLELKEENNSKQDEEVLLDPNDVNKVFVEQQLSELDTFPKYTSPLGSRVGLNDPLTAVCPYDLLGVCKDKDCRYKHYLSS